MLEKIYDLVLEIHNILVKDSASEEASSLRSEEDRKQKLEYIRKYIDENTKLRRDKNG